MSNIRKSFSFRDGVQVDQEVFVVRGLNVGIGTSVPTESFDVRGTAQVIGLVTTTSLIVSGVSTFSNVNVGLVSITSGIVTSASASGIVTYYGDGGRLANLPTSQWLDVDVGIGFTSIYAQGFVGVATDDPRYTFQVGSNPNDNNRGVGISSAGNIRASGIITAKSFVGFGSDITEINASNISSGTLSNDRLPIIDNTRFAPNVNLSGILTANSGHFGTIVSTGNITGIAATARGLIGQPSIDVWNLIVNRNSQLLGISTLNHIDGTSASIGVSTISQQIHVGTGGTLLSASAITGRIGFGTAIPGSDIQLVKTGSILVEVVGQSGQSRISIGQSVGVGNSSSVLRFGSVARTLEIINNDFGGINCYTHSGNDVGVDTGGFKWIYGKDNSTIFSLTYDGKAAVGRENPLTNFDVVGVATITDDLFVDGDLSILGGIVAGTGVNRVSFGNGEYNLLNNTNINVTTGISTVSGLRVIGVGSIGIQTTTPITDFDARSSTALYAAIGIKTEIVSAELTVGGSGVFGNKVGIGTTTFPETVEDQGNLQVYNGGITINEGALVIKGTTQAIGIGSNLPQCALDLSLARAFDGKKSVFVPPHVTQADLDSMGVYSPVGGIVYHTEKKTHYYTRGDGSDWTSITGDWAAGEQGPWTNFAVGIGTDTPISLLQVANGDVILTNSNLGFTTEFGGGNIVGCSSITTDSLYTNYFETLDGGGGKVIISTNYIVAPYIFGNFTGNNSSIIVGGGITCTTSDLQVYSGAKVGIGTHTKPKADLDVTGDVNVTGIITATNGFSSGIGTNVQITTIGNRLIFTVPGVGTTSLRLY